MNRQAIRALLTGKAPPKPTQTSLDPLEAKARAAVARIAADARAWREEQVGEAGRKTPHFLFVEYWPGAGASWWWRPVGFANSAKARRLAERFDDVVVAESQSGPLEQHPDEPHLSRLPLHVFRLSDLETP